MSAAPASYEAIERKLVMAIQAMEQRLTIASKKSAVLDAEAWSKRVPELPFEAPVTIEDPILRGLAIRILARHGLRPGRSSRARGVTFVIDVPDVYRREVVEPELKRLELAYGEYQSAVLRRLEALAFDGAAGDGVGAGATEDP